LRSCIEESNLYEILEDVVQDVSLGLRPTDIRDINLDRHLKKISLNSDILEDYINDFLLKKDWRRNIKNFWYNDTFGSLEQSRLEMDSRFLLEEYSIKLYDSKFLEM
jgi:hypothetical protein